MNKIYLYILVICSFWSCSAEFSNYQKKGKNDLESNGLQGAVRSVSLYNTDGTLLNVTIYNEWGFYIEKKSYNKGVFQDGVLQDVKNYEYDENGCISKMIETDEVTNITTTTSYVYDSHDNILTEWIQLEKEIKTLTTKEVNPISDKTIKTIHEYVYDNNGIKLKEVIYEKQPISSVPYRVLVYNDRGNVIESYRQDSKGKKTALRTFRYDKYGNRIHFILKNKEGHITDSTVTVFMETPVPGEYKRIQSCTYHTPYSTSKNMDSKAEYTYNVQGDVEKEVIERYNNDGSLYNRRVIDIHYEYDEENNWVLKHVSSETKTSDNRVTASDSVGYRREILYL